jgi:hypothetical protein
MTVQRYRRIANTVMVAVSAWRAGREALRGIEREAMI